MSARDELRRAVRSGDRERVLRVTLDYVRTVDPDDATVDLWPWQDALDRFYPGGDGIDLCRHDFSTSRGRAAATTRIARRLRTLYQRATADERADGRGWYDEAAMVAQDASERYGFTREQCAFSIAALSPNVSWSQNVHAFHLACSGYLLGLEPSAYGGSGYHANREKVARILAGDLDALQGPKVTVFAAAILGDRTAVTIDVWMMRACGLADPTPTDRQRRVIVAALEREAKRFNESPRDFQAITWVVVRNGWKDTK